MAPIRAIKETELIERLKSETPKWFKNIIYGAMSLGGTAGAIKAVLVQQAVELAPIYNAVLEYTIVGGLVAAAVAKTACKQAPEPRKKKVI